MFSMECWQIEQPVFLEFSVTLQECVHLFWTLTEKRWGMKVVKLSINRSSSLVLTLRIVVKRLHTCFILVLCTDSVKRCTTFCSTSVNWGCTEFQRQYVSGCHLNTFREHVFAS